MLRIIAAAASLAVMAGAASAATLTGYGSPVDAIPGGVVEGFEATAPGEYASITFGNTTLSGVDGTFTLDGVWSGNYNVSGNSIYNGPDFMPSMFRFDFASVVGALAFNFGASDVNWTLDAFDSVGNLLETLSIAAVHGSSAGEYFGVAASGISYATLSGMGDWVLIDNITTDVGGAVAPVPLPATGLLLIGALGSVGGLSWRRKQRLAA